MPPAERYQAALQQIIDIAVIDRSSAAAIDRSRLPAKLSRAGGCGLKITPGTSQLRLVNRNTGTLMIRINTAHRER